LIPDVSKHTYAYGIFTFDDARHYSVFTDLIWSTQLSPPAYFPFKPANFKCQISIRQWCYVNWYTVISWFWNETAAQNLQSLSIHCLPTSCDRLPAASRTNCKWSELHFTPKLY
jgi:hypothetical protein